MRKPISKNGLRRAVEKVQKDGFIDFSVPIGTVVDKIWHELERKNYDETRRKPVSRETVRIPELPEMELD